jgi:phage shock protein A
LHQTKVKILSEILENTKASNATTSEQLDALKETVDTLQKEISEFENKKSKN